MKFSAFFFALVAAVSAKTLPLDGEWQFQMDREDSGLTAKWFERDLTEKIHLPGILQAQGFGDPITKDTPWVMSLYDRNWAERDDYKDFASGNDIKVPFLCQPARHYLGVAWYQRDIEIPTDAAGQRGQLYLERTRWKSNTWLDDREIGMQDSLVAPHEFELGILKPGHHRLTIRLDNRMLLPYRPDSHAVSDSQGSTWNGIVGKIELRTTSPVWIDETRVDGDPFSHEAKLDIRIGNISGKAGKGTITIGTTRHDVTWDEKGGRSSISVPMGDAAAWDEFSPQTQHLKISLTGPAADDTQDVSFGLRKFATKGTEFTINGRPTHLRGNHDGGGFPLTGHPPMDEGTWRKLLTTYRAWGINHVRFHSWCPPEAAFTAADELGIYLQIEPGMWNPFFEGSEITKMLYTETERIIRAYGNHPSFVMFSPSNEPKGRWQEVLAEWVKHWRAEDPRRLWTTGTGWAILDKPGPTDLLDYHATHRFGTHMMRGNSAWFGKDYSEATQGIDKPVVSHELGQWCAYPDFDVIAKFTGFLKGGNYEIFRASAEKNGVLDRDKAFVMASGKLQLACYKEEIEANLRTPGLGGFQLLDLHDYMGQGTAPVGLLDPFFEEKGYASAKEFSRFCSPTVPLARLRTRIFSSSDKFEIPVEISHYGKVSIKAAAVWKITDATGKTLIDGKFDEREIPLGKGTALGTITADLSQFPFPCACRLEVSGPGFANDWNFWVYPSAQKSTMPENVEIHTTWAAAEKSLADGKRVLFLPRAADLAWDCPPLDRVPLFWNRQMSPGWSRMLGMAVEAKHPALAGFPTEDFGDWQWIDLVGRSRAINLSSLPRDFQPIVQPVDDWNRNWKLGMLFEAKVGPGKLMVCSIDIEKDLAKRPTASQFRRSLLDYMASGAFKPTAEVASNQITGFLFDNRIMQKLGAKASGPLIDGDPNTFWQSSPGHPQSISIEFKDSVPISGLVLMPRQNHRDHEGDIREYRIELSDDGNTWREIKSGALGSSFSPVRIDFGKEEHARHLRFTSLSGFGIDPTSALAELAVIYTGPALGGSGDVEYKRVRSASEDVDEGADLPAKP
ncbi:MAG: discoidin domain-containing protein [Luteolibacter sp.]